MKQVKKIISFVAVGIFAQLLLIVPAIAEEYYTIKDGVLERPTGYREWIYVGTPVTPNDMNNGKAAFPEHHNVYIDPKSWAHWKETGKFREGTILMKELVSVGSKAAVSGQGYFQGEFIGLEATIKSKSNFPDEPGNWAYFSFSSKDHKTLTKTAKPFPSASCNSCHLASASDDFVFTQYYPVLSSGKAKGKKATGGHESDLNNNYIEPKGK
ncbi:cytochrome P460 [Shewanella sp. Choline-02u-19]|uniref:cytochrome P460 family protein n=1 Tax=unclassified Shewanella TaxID=196818 RepID=UPI000C322D8B|nr:MULTISPECIES: cytochrome P460 family protein [unclassified Shewanella]PKH54465.1 cytochrome P460 [Shewanella sp. Bg11-22]PKI28522.1 cytochrome P460 [Shewanella sp. Choline-02u-19]